MNATFNVREITSVREMLSHYPLLKQLSPEIKKLEFAILIKDMVASRYRMAGVFAGKKCVGLSGFWIATKLYSGKYVELDNVVIDKAYRSKGIGKILCEWIIALAKKEGCRTAMLDAYVENSAGHKFYLREGFVIKGFHFLKNISGSRN